MAVDDIPEGYADSPPEETTPLEPSVSLEFADRELAEGGEVTPAGTPPLDDIAEADQFADSPDADQLAAAELGNAGSRPEDAANFEDNSAEWSRERT